MRILFATDQYLPTPGGIATVTQRLSAALANRGHTVAVLAPSTDWKYRRESKDGVTIYRIQSVLVHKLKQIRFSPTFLYKKEITKIITNFKPDIIHLETPNAIASEALIVAQNLNIPTIATCHIMPENISGTLPFLPSKIGKMIGNLFMKQLIKTFNKVELVTTPTEIGTAILIANGIKTPVIALSNGIDLNAFRKPSEEKKEELRKKYNLANVPIILYIGRLDKEKKVNTLIESLRYIDKSLRLHLVIEGKGQQMENLENLANKFALTDKISFIGYIPEDELVTLYSLASVFVMPSTAELQSLVTMEAMAMGLPVIGAAAGALPYLVKPDENGFLFEPDDAADLAGKLNRILKNPQLEKQMGKESLRLIKEHDINEIIQKMEKLYISLPS